MVIIIVAMTSNRVIGYEGSLPWDVPEEYQQYLQFVRGQKVIMGRRSYEIFKQDLTSDFNLVISRQAEDIAGATVVGNVPKAIDDARKLGRTVFVAGGGSIYAQAMPYVDEMYISYIKGDYPGDTFFPDFGSEWLEEKTRDHERFRFVSYKRVRH